MQEKVTTRQENEWRVTLGHAVSPPFPPKRRGSSQQGRSCCDGIRSFRLCQGRGNHVGRNHVGRFTRTGCAGTSVQGHLLHH